MNETLKNINALKAILSDLKKQLTAGESLFTPEYSESYRNSLRGTISIIEKQIEEYNAKLVEVRQEGKRAKREAREVEKSIIAERRDYSNKSDEELRKEYSYIRAQIKRIAKKIETLCDHKDVTTFYQRDENGTIKLVKSEGYSESEMIYEMNEIISELETNLSTIEEYYRGTNLKEVPVLESQEEIDYMLSGYPTDDELIDSVVKRGLGI